MQDNPYSTPETSPELISHDQTTTNELASRWARLAAAIIDSLIMMAITIPLLFLFIGVGIFNTSASASFLENLAALDGNILVEFVFALIGIFIYLAFNGYLMVKNGQTIGKKLLRIKIVDYQNEQLLLASKIIGVRYCLITLIAQVPFVGSLFGLINVLFIFGSEKRCIHDLMAGSKVVKC